MTNMTTGAPSDTIGSVALPPATGPQHGDGQPPASSLPPLERLSQLLALLDDEAYTIAPPDYELPAGFLLSIVVPVYNEYDTIGPILARIASLPIPMELIVVDDASQDGTAEILNTLKNIPHVRIVRHSENRGKGAAVRTGFQMARGTVVMVQDADLEYDPADIPRLIRPLVLGQADVVYGSRFLENRSRGSSWIHQAGNRQLTCLSNVTTGLRLTDMETCYKAFRRELLQRIELQQDRFGFEPEITAKIARHGARIVELPVSYCARTWQQGKKIGFRDAVTALYCIARYAWRD
jgi:glycosyltransferase involved in cell wall biosynthesis